MKLAFLAVNTTFPVIRAELLVNYFDVRISTLLAMAYAKALDEAWQK